MRPVNLFLTEDGMLKLGYYGLMTQAECYSIKKMDCDGFRGFAPVVLKDMYKMKSDVWSLGIALLEMMGVTPYIGYKTYDLPTRRRYHMLPFDEHDIESPGLVSFLKKCFVEIDKGWIVEQLMNVSGMG